MTEPCLVNENWSNRAESVGTWSTFLDELRRTCRQKENIDRKRRNFCDLESCKSCITFGKRPVQALRPREQ